MILVALTITACTVPEVVQVQQPDGTSVLVTNQVVEPRVTAAIETLKVVNTGTAPVNPHAPIIAVILAFATMATTAWGTVATMLKNKKQQQFATVVKGVEKANDPATKKAIETVSIDNGTKLEFDAAVQKVVN